MDSSASCATPIGASKLTASDHDDSFLDITMYHSMVGGLQYLTLTQLDIAFAVNQVAQRVQSPTNRDMRSVKHIFWYIKGSLTRGLTFHHDSSLHLVAYSGADWASDFSARRTESEYHALAHVIADIRWFCYLLCELGIPFFSFPLMLYDNQSALLACGALRLRRVPTTTQLVDLFTKDYEAEQDGRILDFDTTGQMPSRSQQRKEPILELKVEIETRAKAGREAHEARLQMAAMVQAEQAPAESYARDEMMA
ncbi:hypothetical protein Patl1_11355 [Pistacia atlantica]|uniref:Uncharacterized protein n=1 Tax=Pistacia atlantica TaxID=434234 RepID=A0ACC1A6W9_9ROSI|nr:hypothetical protein Patl1_11355 [Pistacia atlantica]